MDETKQLSFNIDQPQTDNGPVVCLGMTFKNDDERREYFRNELRKKLAELKKIEGFPIGDDEDIIALSDPPYYTACPNPWINDFVEEWEKEKVTEYGRDSNEDYHREPFASDVREGKNDPVYNVHTYHTKVPPKAIATYILHYTNPGDIVFDGFCGTGMTGVAAKYCNDINIIESLGYEVKNGLVIEPEGGKVISKLGDRNAILGDLSPAATFIASNYNSDKNINDYIKIANEILIEVSSKYGWLFYSLKEELNDEIVSELTEEFKSCVNEEDCREFFEKNREFFVNVNYVVWSDVFVCPSCSNEIIYWDATYDQLNGVVRDNIICEKCSSNFAKKDLERSYITFYDNAINKTIQQAKQVPVKINYNIGKKRLDKKPDMFDQALLNKIETLKIQYWFPTEEIPIGDKTGEPLRFGLTHTHHFYTKRNLFILSFLWEKLPQNMRWILTSFLSRNITKTNRYIINKYNPRGRINGPLTGTFYIPSLVVEQSALELFRDKIQNIGWKNRNNLIQTISATQLNIKSNSIDYIYIDPPFGANLMYSELNMLWESWLKVKTNTKEEAIQNKTQKKDINKYRDLMLKSFKEAFRILKPNHWITVEFSNTQASVWNSIQTALQEAGFVIANVSVLDKKHGGIKAMTNTTNVKQDLVISAYKPKEFNIKKQSSDLDNNFNYFWNFIENHLSMLPIIKVKDGNIEVIPERDPRIIYDRAVAYLVQKGLNIPYSSLEFQKNLIRKYPERDGMFFLDNQVIIYDKQRQKAKGVMQISLFINDEKSAIDWIRQQLIKKPQTRQDIHPEFMKQIQHIAKHEELPELDDLLEQNFLRYDGEEPVPNQILTYLRRNYKDLRGLEPTNQKVIEKAMHRWYVPDPNKQSDLEKLREKALLREFNQYKDELEGNRKKLRTFRTEAIRAGFKNAYKEKDFETIVKVGDRIPEKVIQEDDKLFMFYENAKIRLGL